MQLPTVFNFPQSSLPPMHLWPRFVKRTLLGLAILAVITAYVFLAGGVVAVFAVMAETFNL